MRERNPVRGITTPLYHIILVLRNTFNTLSRKTGRVFLRKNFIFMAKDYWKKIIAKDNREMKRIEKAKERYERRADKKDAKELKRYEKVLDKGLRL